MAIALRGAVGATGTSTSTSISPTVGVTFYPWLPVDQVIGAPADHQLAYGCMIRWWKRRRGYVWFDTYHGGEWRKP